MHNPSNQPADAYTDLIYANGTMIAEVAGTQTAVATYRHSDHLGSLALQANTSGAVTGTSVFLPFGQTLTETTSDSFQFTGLPQDTENSSYHADFRNFSTQQGRWLSPDPYNGSYDITNPQSFNRYSYALNNPMAFIDPSGLDPSCSWRSVDGILTYNCVGGNTITVNGGSSPDPGDPGIDGVDISPYIPFESLLLMPFPLPGIQAPNNGVPKNPCSQAGGAPNPSWYVGQVQQAGNQLPATAIDSASILMNQVNQFETLFNFHRGGSLDAQPLGASPAYGNYVFGAALSGAGYSLSSTLSAANAYAFLSGAQYPGQTMDQNYGSIPAANVANITNGYNAQQNGTVCHF
ncbi:MAG: RHS repeat-associated core domain-containing protein [Acidobacteriaceae bacterium]